MNKNLSVLMDREVSRGEFLGVLGLAAASVFGLSTIIKLLTGKSLDHHDVSQFGYGASVYGGARSNS